MGCATVARLGVWLVALALFAGVAARVPAWQTVAVLLVAGGVVLMRRALRSDESL